MALRRARLASMALCVAMAAAIPGTFYTNSKMEHRRLPNALPDGVITPTATQQECEDKCSRHPICDAYAYSGFYKTCQLYQVKLGERAIIQNMYKLYIKEKDPDSGFIKFGTDYLKFDFKMKNMKQVKAACAAMGGTPVSIKSEEMNQRIKEELRDRTVSAAFIGLSDEVQEMNWIYADGTPLGEYVNWDWNGVWNRTDLNCAIIGLDGTWSHTNCYFKFYSICQIPMF